MSKVSKITLAVTILFSCLIFTYNTTNAYIYEEPRTVTFPAAIKDIFPDPNLAAIIATRLNGTVDKVVNQTDLNTILYIQANRIEITTLSGMEYLTNLVQLFLYDNKITDLSPIAGLTKLRDLYLDSNNISDYSVLANLTNLETLYLDRCEVTDETDLSVLSGLTKLRSLSLGQNPISDISKLPLSNLTNLEGLFLYMCQIQDISILSEVTTNLKSLYLYSNQISDISVLSKFTNLISLHLNSNHISDISSLSEMTNLNYLALNNNQIRDISALSRLTELTRLHIHMNQITDLSPLAGLSNLSEIYMNNQNITLDEARYSTTIKLDNFIKDINGDLVDPTYIPNDGVYDGSTITWTNLSESVKQLITSFSKQVEIGTTTAEFHVGVWLPIGDKLPPSINANTQITYTQGAEVTEDMFLSDIQAVTDDGTLVTSDFLSIVDFNTIGEYIVTLQSNNGLEATPFTVTVNIVETIKADQLQANDFSLPLDEASSLTAQKAIELAEVTVVNEAIRIDIGLTSLQVNEEELLAIQQATSTGKYPLTFTIAEVEKTVTVELLASEAVITETKGSLLNTGVGDSMTIFLISLALSAGILFVYNRKFRKNNDI